MSPLDVVTRRELNRIFLKYCSFRQSKRVFVQKQLLEKNRAVVYIFGANFRSISTITNFLKTQGLKGTLNKI